MVKSKIGLFLAVTVFALLTLHAKDKSKTRDGFPACTPDSIRIQYGNDQMVMTKTEEQVDLKNHQSTSAYSCKSFAGLKIGLITGNSYVESTKVTKYEVEISSVTKLEKELSVLFPLKALRSFDSIQMPLKNGLVCKKERFSRHEIASYRCAGIPEKYANDLAIPMVIVSARNNRTAICTDPYFTSLYQSGAIKWSYPKKVGLEDKSEKRTIVLVDGVGNIDSGMDLYYRTVLKDIPPGPDWAKDIAMISYDYMSDRCRGWYNDIDSLTNITTPEDRHKIALCLHGWYDIVGRYCFDEKTGKLDQKWNNRITKMDLSLADLHERITYAKKKIGRAHV